MGFLFPALVLLIFLLILCTYVSEKAEKEKALPPQAQEVSKPLKVQDKSSVTWNKEMAYSSLKRHPEIRDSETPISHRKKLSEEHPHDHQEHHPDMPYAIRPRRLIIRKPEEKGDEDEEYPVKKSMVIQTDEEERIVVKTPQSSLGTSCDVERENDATQTDLPAPRASIGVQTDTKIADEESSESFESCPLKPKYLSSPSQSEEEESELSSNVERERYSIIQPFMCSRKESEEE